MCLHLINHLLHILNFTVKLRDHIVFFLDYMYKCLKPLVFRVNINAHLLRRGRLLSVFSVDGRPTRTLWDVEVPVEVWVVG